MRKSYLGKLNYGIWGICIALSLILSGCATVYNPVTEREETTLIGEKSEIQIGKEAAISLEKQYGVVKNSNFQPRLNTIGGKIAKMSGRSHLPYTFKILKTDDVNALALPGGPVYITEGLLKEVETESQLACVLGHEVGHICARHSVKRIEAQFGYSLLYSILLQGEQEDIQNLANMAFNLTSLGYSRSDEFQADELGVTYAYRAGYNPYGMAEFLKILKKSYKRNPSHIETFFSTHPHVDDRIDRAEKLAAQIK
jgi:predicted Zn-dependent protease